MIRQVPFCSFHLFDASLEDLLPFAGLDLLLLELCLVISFADREMTLSFA